ncbi:hypothetical protein GW793_01360 [bacterium]|uniref:PsbP C-terminal domain-containing protein n=2 Tax=Katanobacteria TaxID=422282 RepID=A0A2M7X341_UNCKA|nr:hypothetical protein [bacterium]PIP56212.1 MAG: hypothetical protein COX05_04300 [candidate division WWE3 bacterium CG22_combo_CG10-13_8_21_14_all_39_12]PJA40391.1 MAG: hypothetical protein CO179_02375 [candidate division WWE3 bacterium CG_4_9_14_3_um_filter_39_7]
MIKQNSGNVMIAVLAVGLLLGIGFWYVITQRDVVSPEPTPTVTPTPEIQELTSTVDTSDWIVAGIDNSRVFTYKYPPTWIETRSETGYKYQPETDDKYTFYTSTPLVDGSTIENNIKRISNTTEVIGNTSQYKLEGKNIIVLTTKNQNEPVTKIITYVFIDDFTYIDALREKKLGVAVFSSTYYSEVNEYDPYLSEILNIISTLTVIN